MPINNLLGTVSRLSLTKLSNTTKPDIMLCTKVLHAKFLGIGTGHINILVKNLNSIVYGILVIGRYMNEDILRIMYFESMLKYDIISCRDNRMQRVFVVQKLDWLE